MSTSPACCYEESNATVGLVSIDDLLTEYDTPPRLSYPTPFIATAAAPSHISSHPSPVPSAPLLPDADLSSLASTSGSAAPATLSTSLSSAQPGSSRHPNSALAYTSETILDLVGPFEPPPYTPLDDAYHTSDPSSDPPSLKEDSIR
ncbi:hypothetical protein H4S08_000267 [Coemansia sp. RSA 1365]|nr:hypothetical protein H4S08_000267 [Coemansia sp. RSA 1365]